MQEQIRVSTDSGESIRAVYSRPDEMLTDRIDRTLIIMVHGFPSNKNGHSNLYQSLEYVVAEKNFHTLRFDFRGCGESDGDQEDFSFASAQQDLQYIIAWGRGRGYKEFIFISEGLGSSLTLINAPRETICHVLLWPMLDLPRIAKINFQSDKIEEQWKKAGYILLNKNRIGFPLIEQLNTMQMAGKIRDTDKPMLIMHGANDHASPIDQLDMIREHANARRVEITSFQDGEHGLPKLNHRKTMFFHIHQFLEKYT